MLYIGSATVAIRLIEKLKILKKTRTIVILLVQTIVDMIPFLIILFFIIFMFSLLDLVTYKHQVGEERSFTDAFYYQYSRIFGADQEIDMEKSYFFVLNFFLHTIVIFTMTMNLLISIISNTYEKMQNIELALDVKMKTGLMEEIEVLLIGNRNKGTKQYLHVVKYSQGE